MGFAHSCALAKKPLLAQEAPVASCGGIVVSFLSDGRTSKAGGGVELPKYFQSRRILSLYQDS